MGVRKLEGEFILRWKINIILFQVRVKEKSKKIKKCPLNKFDETPLPKDKKLVEPKKQKIKTLGQLHDCLGPALL